MYNKFIIICSTIGLIGGVGNIFRGEYTLAGIGIGCSLAALTGLFILRSVK